MANKNPKTKHLTKWKKGQSGNPHGRPKQLPVLKDLLTKLIGASDDSEPSELELMINACIDEAKNAPKGKRTAALNLLLDRAFGKVKSNEGDGVTRPIEWIETKTYKK